MAAIWSSSIKETSAHSADPNLYLQKYLQTLTAYYYCQHISNLIREIKANRAKLEISPAAYP